MSAKNIMMAAAGNSDASALYSDDVFSTYLYTGNGATQTINNGIDLAGKGGMVWIKCRTADATYGLHRLFDTARGVTKYLNSALTNAEATDTKSVTSFSSTGFSLGFDAYVNKSGNSFTSWTFREAPKFFDVVTYTGDGATDKMLTHSLGVEPGMVIIKSTSATNTNWIVQHRDLLPSRQYLKLNSTDYGTATASSPTAISWSGASTFYVHGGWPTGTGNDLNTNGVQYNAYLFAHDTSVDGLIQCGSFTTDGSGNATVNLGWEPQWLMLKTTGALGSWDIFDSMRGLNVSSTTRLSANTSTQENNQTTNYVKPTSTGFEIVNGFGGANNTHIYIAIRRPNKPPTTGTEVYNAIAGTFISGTRVNFGFPADMFLSLNRAYNGRRFVEDRLRGFQQQNAATNVRMLFTETAGAEAVGTYDPNFYAVDNTGAYVGYNPQSTSYGFEVFRRAPGFFDVVCYTGTGSATTVAHNLGVAPELMIVKARTTTSGIEWYVFHSTLGTSGFIQLNSTGANIVTPGFWSSTPTASGFTPCNYQFVSAVSYVAYLFATCPGVSKVGSYTGNGSSQTINCGFTTGARFVLIKRTDSTGDWYVWDTARGIVASNDPHLSLNTTAPEVTTDDSIDPNSSGFIVNQVSATNINVSAATYIYLAIA